MVATTQFADFAILSRSFNFIWLNFREPVTIRPAGRLRLEACWWYAVHTMHIWWAISIRRRIWTASTKCAAASRSVHSVAPNTLTAAYIFVQHVDAFSRYTSRALLINMNFMWSLFVFATMNSKAPQACGASSVQNDFGSIKLRPAAEFFCDAGLKRMVNEAFW